MVTTKIYDKALVDYPEYIGKELIAKHWHPEDEDSIYCECVGHPHLSGYFNYVDIDDYSIYK